MHITSKSSHPVKENLVTPSKGPTVVTKPGIHTGPKRPSLSQSATDEKRKSVSPGKAPSTLHKSGSGEVGKAHRAVPAAALQSHSNPSTVPFGRHESRNTITGVTVSVLASKEVNKASPKRASVGSPSTIAGSVQTSSSSKASAPPPVKNGRTRAVEMSQDNGQVAVVTRVPAVAKRTVSNESRTSHPQTAPKSTEHASPTQLKTVDRQQLVGVDSKFKDNSAQALPSAQEKAPVQHGRPRRTSPNEPSKKAGHTQSLPLRSITIRGNRSAESSESPPRKAEAKPAHVVPMSSDPVGEVEKDLAQEEMELTIQGLKEAIAKYEVYVTQLEEKVAGDEPESSPPDSHAVREVLQAETTLRKMQLDLAAKEARVSGMVAEGERKRVSAALQVNLETQERLQELQAVLAERAVSLAGSKKHEVAYKEEVATVAQEKVEADQSIQRLRSMMDEHESHAVALEAAVESKDVALQSGRAEAAFLYARIAELERESKAKFIHDAHGVDHEARVARLFKNELHLAESRATGLETELQAATGSLESVKAVVPPIDACDGASVDAEAMSAEFATLAQVHGLQLQEDLVFLNMMLSERETQLTESQSEIMDRDSRLQEVEERNALQSQSITTLDKKPAIKRSPPSSMLPYWERRIGTGSLCDDFADIELSPRVLAQQEEHARKRYELDQLLQRFEADNLERSSSWEKQSCLLLSRRAPELLPAQERVRPINGKETGSELSKDQKSLLNAGSLAEKEEKLTVFDAHYEAELLVRGVSDCLGACGYGSSKLHSQVNGLLKMLPLSGQRDPWDSSSEEEDTPRNKRKRMPLSLPDMSWTDSADIDEHPRFLPSRTNSRVMDEDPGRVPSIPSVMNADGTPGGPENPNFRSDYSGTANFNSYDFDRGAAEEKGVQYLIRGAAEDDVQFHRSTESKFDGRGYDSFEQATQAMQDLIVQARAVQDTWPVESSFPTPVMESAVTLSTVEEEEAMPRESREEQERNQSSDIRTLQEPEELPLPSTSPLSAGQEQDKAFDIHLLQEREEQALQSLTKVLEERRREREEQAKQAIQDLIAQARAVKDQWPLGSSFPPPSMESAAIKVKEERDANAAQEDTREAEEEEEEDEEGEKVRTVTHDRLRWSAADDSSLIEYPASCQPSFATQASVKEMLQCDLHVATDDDESERIAKAETAEAILEQENLVLLAEKVSEQETLLLLSKEISEQEQVVTHVSSWKESREESSSSFDLPCASKESRNASEEFEISEDEASAEDAEEESQGEEEQIQIMQKDLRFSLRGSRTLNIEELWPDQYVAGGQDPPQTVKVTADYLRAQRRAEDRDGIDLVRSRASVVENRAEMSVRKARATITGDQAALRGFMGLPEKEPPKPKRFSVAANLADSVSRSKNATPDEQPFISETSKRASASLDEVQNTLRKSSKEINPSSQFGVSYTGLWVDPRADSTFHTQSRSGGRVENHIPKEMSGRRSRLGDIEALYPMPDSKGRSF